MNRKFIGLLTVVLIVTAGCVSVPASREPVFYGIAALGENEVVPIALTSDFAVAVGEIKIPGYLNRPHIVTQDARHQMHFAQFDRWAEPLEEGITRAVKANLTRILPRAQVVSYPVDFPSDTAFRVDMELTRFELDLSGELFLVVQWAVVDVGYPKYTIIQRSEFRIPVKNGNYAGAVNAVSDACASLSNQIAKIVYRMSEVPHT